VKRWTLTRMATQFQKFKKQLDKESNFELDWISQVKRTLDVLSGIQEKWRFRQGECTREEKSW
jgi:hypothetical protein